MLYWMSRLFQILNDIDLDYEEFEIGWLLYKDLVIAQIREET
jgi:hypothetical protein